MKICVNSITCGTNQNLLSALPGPDKEDSMNIEYRYANNESIQIRVDLERSEATIQYRLMDVEDDEWKGTPFQRADVANEDEALALVDAWLE